jgi:hypothetical protein
VLDHLGWLRHSGQLHAFDDRQIKPGEQWDPRIRRELEAAHVIMVLLSPRFVGSRFCTIEELVRAVERQRQGTACSPSGLMRQTGLVEERRISGSS